MHNFQLTIKLLMLSIFTSLLVGCGTTSKVTTVELKQTEFIYADVPKRLVEPCIPERMMNKESYLKLLPHEKEKVQAEYIITLYGVIKTCNDQLKEIDKLLNVNKNKKE